MDHDRDDRQNGRRTDPSDRHPDPARRSGGEVERTRTSREDTAPAREDTAPTRASHEDASRTPAREGAARDDPDVYLDVPTLKVDQVDLEVEDLRARVSLRAEVLDLLKLNVGVDVVLGQVKLDISDVEAQALLKVRLDNVADIVAAVLRTIEHNPQIVEHATRPLASTAEALGSGAGQAAGELARGTGEAAKDVGETAKGMGETARSATGEAAEGAKTLAGETVGTAAEASHGDRPERTSHRRHPKERKERRAPSARGTAASRRHAPRATHSGRTGG